MRIKSTETRQFEKLLILLSDGQPRSKQQIVDGMSSKIDESIIPRLMYDCKKHANATIRTTKNGTTVLSYQCVNTDEVKVYIKQVEDRIQAAKTVKPVKKAAKSPTKKSLKKTKTKINKIADLNVKETKEPEKLVVEEIVQ